MWCFVILFIIMFVFFVVVMIIDDEMNDDRHDGNNCYHPYHMHWLSRTTTESVSAAEFWTYK